VAGGDRSRDRRRIRAEQGRRVAERRALALPVEQPALPPRLRRHAEAIVFIERLEPSTEAARDIDTARLVIRSQAGDAGVFKDLYLRYFDGVYSYVRVVLDEHGEAEDVTQDVFIKVFQALPRYVSRSDTPFRAWLFRIARNAAIDRLKQMGRLHLEEPELIGRRVDSSPAGVTDLQLDWVSDSDLLFLIERLPQPQRQVLALRYALGLTAKEIAVVMDRSPEAVAQLHSRARAFLEERLGALRTRDAGASRRAPMLIRLRRMPVLGARRAVLTAPRIAPRG
jgi:RNA polymerase sigma-70 factor (ECF subfamily)